MVFKIDGFPSREDSDDGGYRPWSYAIYLLLADNVKFFSKNCFSLFSFSNTWIHMCIVKVVFSCNTTLYT